MNGCFLFVCQMSMLITSIIVGLNYMYNTTIVLSISLSQLGFNIAWKCPIRSIHFATRNNVLFEPMSIEIYIGFVLGVKSIN